jgi:glycine/D-amino acid oxidase-like deaminating enzyme
VQAGHAEIVGAGFGGLVAAIALREHGWTVPVHERRGATKIHDELLKLGIAPPLRSDMIFGRDKLVGLGCGRLTRRTGKFANEIDELSKPFVPEGVRRPSPPDRAAPVPVFDGDGEFLRIPHAHWRWEFKCI